jgi:protein SCO1/2
MKSLQQKSHLKLILLLLLFSAAVVFIALYFGVIAKHHKTVDLSKIKIDGVVLTETKDIPDFTFIDHRGNGFTKFDLKAHWSMLFFGFTNCGYVCPTTLTELNKMYRKLEQDLPEDQLPRVILISVDPERDTASRMSQYLSAFNPNFIGVTGDPAAIDAFSKQLHIAVIKMEAEGEGANHYMINHSSEILLINPEGKIQAYLSYPHEANQMEKDYKEILTALS